MLEPRSRRPRSSPSRPPETVRSQALQVRAALERSGLDHGPISVHDKMASMGLKAPSPAWLAQLFRDQGWPTQSRPRDHGRPGDGSSTPPQRLLAAQAPPSTSSPQDARWSSPRLQDDHSRLAVASLVASSETSQAAIDVFNKGVATQGVPQRLRGRQRHRPPTRACPGASPRSRPGTPRGSSGTPTGP